MLTEKLFSTIDETNHVYTWDYTVQERALALLDVNEEYFALITERKEIEDETGAMGDYRDNSWFFGYLFQKANPQPVEKIPRGERGTSTVKSFVTKESIITEIKEKKHASEVKELDNIALSIGRVYISDSNLILDRKTSRQ
ncbi:hypothetical protein HZC30_05995 [Candidatus Woesearchaeota archaeon]|nr:hypothetical protein [Candidatus Woesearchaeota archaeon]